MVFWFECTNLSNFIWCSFQHFEQSHFVLEFPKNLHPLFRRFRQNNDFTIWDKDISKLMPVSKNGLIRFHALYDVKCNIYVVKYVQSSRLYTLSQFVAMRCCRVHSFEETGGGCWSMALGAHAFSKQALRNSLTYMWPT